MPPHSSHEEEKIISILHLKPSTLPPSPPLLKLPPLTLHIRFLPLMRPKAKMLNSLSILRSPQQHTITPLRRPQRQLIKRQALPASLLDPSTSSAGEAKGCDCHFWDGQGADVVGDGADDDEDFGVFGHFFGVRA